MGDQGFEPATKLRPGLVVSAKKRILIGVELLAFYDLLAEHWVHLRTGNVIESAFATVRLRQRVTKGAGSRSKGLLIAFQLLAMVERRWRRGERSPSRAPGPSRGGLPRRRRR